MILFGLCFGKVSPLQDKVPLARILVVFDWQEGDYILCDVFICIYVKIQKKEDAVWGKSYR